MFDLGCRDGFIHNQGNVLQDGRLAGCRNHAKQARYHLPDRSKGKVCGQQWCFWQIELTSDQRVEFAHHANLSVPNKDAGAFPWVETGVLSWLVAGTINVQPFQHPLQDALQIEEIHLPGFPVLPVPVGPFAAQDDRQAGQRYVLDGVHLVTGALAPGAKVPVEGGVTFTSNKPAMTLKAALNAEISTDTALTVFRVSGLLLTLDAAGEGLPSGGAKLTLKTDLVADTGADTLALDNLAVSGPAMAATGRIFTGCS